MSRSEVACLNCPDFGLDHAGPPDRSQAAGSARLVSALPLPFSCGSQYHLHSAAAATHPPPRDYRQQLTLCISLQLLLHRPSLFCTYLDCLCSLLQLHRSLSPPSPAHSHRHDVRFSPHVASPARLHLLPPSLRLCRSSSLLTALSCLLPATCCAPRRVHLRCLVLRPSLVLLPHQHGR